MRLLFFFAVAVRPNAYGGRIHAKKDGYQWMTGAMPSTRC